VFIWKAKRVLPRKIQMESSKGVPNQIQAQVESKGKAAKNGI
jgi:hypothetical protein